MSSPREWYEEHMVASLLENDEGPAVMQAGKQRTRVIIGFEAVTGMVGNLVVPIGLKAAEFPAPFMALIVNASARPPRLAGLPTVGTCLRHSRLGSVWGTRFLEAPV